MTERLMKVHEHTSKTTGIRWSVFDWVDDALRVALSRAARRVHAPVGAQLALAANMDPERVELSVHKRCMWLNVCGDVTADEAEAIAEAADRLDAEWESLVVYACNGRRGFRRVDVELEQSRRDLRYVTPSLGDITQRGSQS